MKKSNMEEEINTLKWLLLKTHQEALVKNEEQTARWELYKSDLESLSSRLLSFRDQLTHPIMVPIGGKALMKGNLVHTNEILVCLGDNWFTKQSAKEAVELCQRRIKSSEEMVAKLNKERELLESRMEFPMQNDAFVSEDAQEIVEPYDENSEKEWRARHRQKEQEYHQKLAELRKQQKPQIETEEDLWKRLDALDLQEELEDELNRLEGERKYESDSYETDSQTQESDSNDEISEDEMNEKKMQANVQVRKSQHRISFDKGSDSEEDSPVQIFFKHSDSTVKSSTCIDLTPASIYTKYSECFNKMPKSILKKTNSLNFEEKSVEDANKISQVLNFEEKSFESENKTSQVQYGRDSPEHVIPTLSDVIERTQPSTQVSTNTRPVSKFKASRQAAKIGSHKS